MKVFLSWSGEKGRSVAKPLKPWLEAVVPGAKAFFSPTDIEKGATWREQLASELRASRAAVVCLTPEALRSPWVMFETGAIYNAVRGKRIYPVLFDVDPDGVKGPVSDFQLTVYEREDVLRLVESLNALGGARLPARKLRARFTERWPALDAAIRKALAAAPSADLLEQIPGFWWEQHRSRGKPAIGWTEARLDRARDSVSLEGCAYTLDGARLSRWETRVASVDRQKRQIEYYWEGSRFERPGAPSGGYGEVTFELATPVRRGEGSYYDLSLQGRGAPKKRLVEVFRATPEDERTMTRKNEAAQRECVRRKVRELAGTR